jgi:hypothetical protein
VGGNSRVIVIVIGVIIIEMEVRERARTRMGMRMGICVLCMGGRVCLRLYTLLIM